MDQWIRPLIVGVDATAGFRVYRGERVGSGYPHLLRRL